MSEASSPLLGLHELPLDVIRVILAFVAVPKSLCRLACTNRCFANLTMEDVVWKVLYQNRWTTEVTATQDFNREYKHRHGLDRLALRLLQEMAYHVIHHHERERLAAEEFAIEITSLNSWPGIDLEYNRRIWKTLRSSEFGNNIYDMLQAVATRQEEEYFELANNGLHSRLTRFLAAQALKAIHHSQILVEWHEFIGESATIETESSSCDNDNTKTSAAILERGALLLCKSEMTTIELLSPATPQNLNDSIVEQLDELANIFQDKLSARGTCDTMSSIHVLNDFLFREAGFTGNESDYYNVQNSLLNHVLKDRRGIPISLAVLYSCLFRRVGIHVDMIGLPGHFVVGVGSLEDDENRVFVDVFHGGRILTLRDCQAIVASYGYSWRHEFVTPLDPLSVLGRMLNNLMVCYKYLASTGPQYRFALERVHVLSLLQHGDNTRSSKILQLWPGQIPLIMERHLLQYFNVLRTRRRAVFAPN